MDIFKQNKYLQWTVVILVILNLLTLSALWFGRPKQPPERGEGPMPPIRHEQRIKKLLKEQLGFNAQQVEQYLKLREKHNQQANRLENELRELKRNMFEQVLDENAPETISDSLLQLVLNKQAELEKMTFRHFLELKKLCGPGQKEKLRMLMREVFRRQAPPQEHPGPDQKRAPKRPQR